MAPVLAPEARRAKLSAKDAAYTRRVLAEVEDRLVRAAEGASLVDVLGPADDVAMRVAAAVPSPSRFARQIGPVYRQADLARRWGCTRQAVHDRITKRKLLAVTTSDGVTLVPAAQLDDQLRPLKGLAVILERLDRTIVDDWTLLSWLIAPQPLLANRSVIDALRAGDDPAELDTVVRAAYQRWAH